jgi:hypothetical protein
VRTSRAATAAFVIVTVFTLLCGVAIAHHGRAGYADKVSTVKGVVKTVEWKNPHVYLNFTVKDDGGKVTEWVGELSSPSTMLAAGMSRTTLKPGDEIVVKGKGGTGGNPVVLIDSITKDGKPIVGDPNAEGRFIENTR